MKHAITLLCLVTVLAASPLAAQVRDETILTFGQGHDKARKVEFLSHLIHLGLERLGLG